MSRITLIPQFNESTRTPKSIEIVFLYIKHRGFSVVYDFNLPSFFFFVPSFRGPNILVCRTL